MTSEGAGAPPRAGADGSRVVDVRALGKRYGAQWAVRDLTFEVARGEIFGIIGPNGAGKTTTLKVLAGLLTPTAGEARVNGYATSDPRLKARVGYLPEESPLYEDMTPRAYLRFFAELYEVPRREADARIERWLTTLDLDVRDEKKIGDLSKGQRRKVAIARSLVNDPDLVIYDEPASGLDPVASATILDLVKRLKSEGKTVLFSAHNLYHVERICDRVLMLRKGEAVAFGTMREIRAQARGTEYRVRTSVPVRDARPTEEGFELTVTRLEDVAVIEREAEAAGGRLLDVRTTDLPLEEIFLRTAANRAPRSEA